MQSMSTSVTCRCLTCELPRQAAALSVPVPLECDLRSTLQPYQRALAGPPSMLARQQIACWSGHDTASSCRAFQGVPTLSTAALPAGRSAAHAKRSSRRLSCSLYTEAEISLKPGIAACQEARYTERWPLNQSHSSVHAQQSGRWFTMPTVDATNGVTRSCKARKSSRTNL